MNEVNADGKKMEKNKYSKLIFGIYGVLVVFGWSVPNDLLVQSASLRAFCDFMASIIPQIDRVTTLGGATAGNANRVIYSVLWCLVVLSAPFFAIVRCRHVLREGFEPTRRRIPWWQVLLLSTFGIWLLRQSFVMEAFRPGLRLVTISLVNRFFAALWAPIFSFGTLFVLLGFVFLAWGLATGRISMSIGGEKNE